MSVLFGLSAICFRYPMDGPPISMDEGARTIAGSLGLRVQDSTIENWGPNWLVSDSSTRLASSFERNSGYASYTAVASEMVFSRSTFVLRLPLFVNLSSKRISSWETPTAG